MMNADTNIPMMIVLVLPRCETTSVMSFQAGVRCASNQRLTPSSHEIASFSW